MNNETFTIKDLRDWEETLEVEYREMDVLFSKDGSDKNFEYMEGETDDKSRKILNFKVQDPFVEFNLGNLERAMMIKLSDLLKGRTRRQLIELELIKLYKYYFSWYYHEIPTLTKNQWNIGYQLRNGRSRTYRNRAAKG